MKVGILTGGGDAPGTNAVIRALTQALSHGQGATVVGIEDGFLGLMEHRVRPLDWSAVGDAVALGGTLLGSTNRASPLNYQGEDRRGEVLACAQALGLDGLVVIGGDGTLAIAEAMNRFGLPCIGVPKTIDNDIHGVERSFGFDTAVARAAEGIERVQTSGQSMHRVMLVETMGRNAGWIALDAGLAAGADIILLPELPFDIDAIAEVCLAREAKQRFTTMCVAEGAKPCGGEAVARAWVEGAPEPARLGGIAAVLAHQLQTRLRSEVRSVALGHVQRGGPPTASDRVLGTHYGAAAAELVREGAWGCMVTWVGGRMARADLASVAGRTRPVPLDAPLLRVARQLGVSFGQA
jgi:6-phosphofructokinase 1